MREIMALGYVVISAVDLDEWSTFARDGLGLQSGPAPAGLESETAFFRIDERSWRFAIIVINAGLKTS